MFKTPAFAQLTITVFCLVFNCPIFALAQSKTTGAISGYVCDAASNSPLAGITVEVTNKETGIPASRETDGKGYFFIHSLPSGSYLITINHAGWERYTLPQSFQVDVRTDNRVKPPEISLRRKRNPNTDEAMDSWEAAYGSLRIKLEFVVQPVSWTPSPAPLLTETEALPFPSQNPTSANTATKQLVNTSSAIRGGVIDEHSLLGLPLPGLRTIESLAFLFAGVAPPPEPLGRTVGPGIGAGIGTAGQFSINGQRARANNFTIDGSDNNDEDIGVRRQGFVALVPQSIESIQEFYLATHLWEAWEGRNVGSQVDVVSRSGTNSIHGTIYDFFNHNTLNARSFFDYTTNKTLPPPVLMAKLPPGQTVNGNSEVPVTINGMQIEQPSPSEGQDPSHRHQAGLTIGGPVSKKYFGSMGSNAPYSTFFFGSFERQFVKARQETHFSVPTVAQRGFLGTGATGFALSRQQNYFPTFFAGDAIFSLFPFPNHPTGPYGENTFTQVLPADAEGTVFSFRLDHNFKLFRPEIKHAFSARYNFTTDRRQTPSVGGAIFSGLEPQVSTQNLSLVLDTQVTERLSNQLRGSYGRTHLRFEAIRDDTTRPSQFFPADPLLLNQQRLDNRSFPNSRFASYTQGPDADSNLGPVGQVLVTPFSPVGADVQLFPQGRVNNTFQLADMLTAWSGQHTFKLGLDIRRTHLNSFLNRNFRPQIVFAGSPDITGLAIFDPLFAQSPRLIRNLSTRGPTPGYFSGADLAAVGIPTGIFQSLAIGAPDSTIGLRFWQHNFFFNDNWRLWRGFTLDYGLRYEYNTVPREVNRRIERALKLADLPAADLTLRLADPLTNQIFDTKRLAETFEAISGELLKLLGQRTTIYEPDRNNFGPHLSFAWDPFAASNTQAGRTAVRGGFGVYYDVTLGSIVSQSRNVFPTFVPVNVDANTFPGRLGVGEFFSPFVVQLDILNQNQNRTRHFLLRRDQLNVLNLPEIPAGALRPLLGLLFNPAAAANLPPSGGGLAFTLPERRLRSPYAYHFNLQIERELFRDYLANLAYVGSRGLKLTRFRTPNGGANSPTFPLDPLLLALPRRIAPARAIPPLSKLDDPNGSRPLPGLGAFTIFDSSAASSYHALQVSIVKRFSAERQITAAYTWSHSIDDVSDVFDLAGSFALPQDDRNLRDERGDANFDLRHRFTASLLTNLPYVNRFDRTRGAKGTLLGGWRLALLSTYQTGQPFTVNTGFDVNLDGNLTDRLNTIEGLRVTDERQQRLMLTVPSTKLLAPLAQNGQVGRNTFRAAGVAQTDVALIKHFSVGAEHSFVLRVEAFNLWNRTHFRLPVRILEAPSFGRSVATSLSARQVQFALKYLF